VTRTPYEIEVAGRSHVATTDASGRLSAPAILPATAHAVSLRLLDGFGLGLAPDADAASNRELRVPCAESGRMRDTYLLETAGAMVLVSVPQPATGPIARAVTALDLIGTHGPGELLTILSASEIAALRALGIEVLVLDVDANSYAARTSDMTDSERSVYIDARMQEARSKLRRLRAAEGVAMDGG
jgi:hypothetical protein